MDAGELATKMAAGSVDICMLPVPNSTSVLVKNPQVRAALSLGDEWKKIAGGSELTQGCVVVRADLNNADGIIADFLKEYETSVSYMASAENLVGAAALAFKYGMVASEEIAKAAIPDCSLTFIAGASEIKSGISGYFDVLFKADPKALGGAIPDDAFYFGNA
jgi:NitT/TauT family transport system substrate-binding protein